MDTTITVILVIVAAIVLDWLFVSGRSRRRAAQKAEQGPPETIAPAPGDTNPAPPDSMPATPAAASQVEAPLAADATTLTTPMLAAPAIALTRPATIMAIGSLAIAVTSQVLLLNNQPLFGGIGYMISAVLFVRALRAQMPERMEPEPETEPIITLTPTPTPSNRPAWLNVSLPKLPLASKPASPPPLDNAPPSFWRHWRYYTLSNLIKGTEPNIPRPPAPPPVENVAPTPVPAPSSEVAVVPAVPKPITSEPVIVTPVAPPPALPTTQPVVAPLATPVVPSTPSSAPIPSSAPAQPVSLPSRPAARLMLISPLNEVVVLDAGKQTLIHFDPNGALLKQLSAVNIPPAATANDVTFSPDGNTIYVFNPADASLQVFHLR
jgi:hypothetical protein